VRDDGDSLRRDGDPQRDLIRRRAGGKEHATRTLHARPDQAAQHADAEGVVVPVVVDVQVAQGNDGRCRREGGRDVRRAVEQVEASGPDRKPDLLVGDAERKARPTRRRQPDAGDVDPAGLRKGELRRIRQHGELEAARVAVELAE
jgi:hypothetical protein